MVNNKMRIFLDKLREVLSHVNLKTYLYGIATVAVIAMILINVTGPSKYGSVKKDGKFYLDIDQVAKDYGFDLNQEGENFIDYVNSSDNNLTQDLSRSLLITNMYLEQSGMTDANARGEVLANIAKEYQKQALGREYTENDLNIIREENTQSIQDYYDSLNSAIKDYTFNLKNININDLSKIYSNKTEFTESDLVNMKSIISANVLKITEINNNFINTILGIPATKAAAAYQLQLINLISKQNTYIKALAQIEIDPAKYVLINGDLFESSFKTDLSSINEQFLEYFKKYKIKF